MKKSSERLIIPIHIVDNVIAANDITIKLNENPYRYIIKINDTQ